MAGLHYLVLGGELGWDEVERALVEQRSFLRRFVAEQNVQTNEVQRSWMLLPCFLEVARRTGAETFDLLEFGPSAGLNLVWDRYRYRYEAGEWGAKSQLRLSGDERRAVPADVLGVKPVVRRRVGVDVAPIDVTREDGARLLKSFVWPDQAWRLELLDRAIAELRRDPPELVRGDIVDALPALLAQREEGALTVVFETAVLVYLAPEVRRSVRDALAKAGQAAPLAFVSTGRPADDAATHFGLHVSVWPGGTRELVAHADFHGAWLEWLV